MVCGLETTKGVAHNTQPVVRASLALQSVSGSRDGSSSQFKNRARGREQLRGLCVRHVTE